ncbi:peroxiredoxin [Candidatus Gracilibacteria bacterium]|nr:peroxiredoxin [Candidatus Gracilibacteria bacterium]
MIQVGKTAPKFALEALVKDKFKKVSLADYKGRWTVLFFYPLDFTFVCPTEILEFSKRFAEFEKLNARVVGCSVDSVYSHLAWSKDLGELSFPLMSDITREVSREYGVLIEDKGVALRGLFIIDPDGILRYSVVHDLNVGRSVDETLRVLQALQSGELCQVGWKPGQKTLGKS